MAEAGTKLTKRVVDLADPKRGRHWLWDGELRGFGLQVETSGTKTYLVRYRPKGLGRDGARRFVKLGRHGDLTAEQAREQAKVILGQVALGRDPAAEKVTEREGFIAGKLTPTFQAVSDLFLNEHVAPKRKGATAALYDTLLRVHVLPVLGKHKIEAVTRAHVTSLHGDLQAKKATANRILTVVSSLHTFAATRSLVPENYNPTRGIEKYPEEGRERYLTKDELQRLGAALIEAQTIGVPWVIDEANPKSKHVPKLRKGQRQVLDPHAVAAIRLLVFTGAPLSA